MNLPQYIVVFTLAASVTVDLSALAYLSAPEPLTFEQRWKPVELLDTGWRGDLFQPKPIPKPVKAKHWDAHRRYAMVECTSFCEFP